MAAAVRRTANWPWWSTTRVVPCPGHRHDPVKCLADLVWIRGRLAHTNPMRDSYASSREPENAGESNLQDIKTTALPGCEGLHPNADALNGSCLVDEPRSLGDGEVRKARHAVGTSLRNSAAQLGRSLSLDQAAVSALRVELAEPLTSKSSHVRSGL